MNAIHSLLFSMMMILLLTGCEEENASAVSPKDGEDWLIPVSQVFDGGPGKDGIPAVDNPVFTDADGAHDLDPGDLVVGIVIDGHSRAYPHDILDWHEIVNDNVAGTEVAVTYCPLTGSAVGWARSLSEATTTFGVSGLLYNSNLMPYDRATDTYWSQMRLQAVHGALIGTEPELIPVIETNWRTWKLLYPETRVMTRETGYSRPYGRYPYGDYKQSGSLIFPVARSDSRLFAKERVHGVIIDGAVRAYPLSEFPRSITPRNDSFGGKPIVVVGSSTSDIAAAYERRMPDGTVLEFAMLQEADFGTFGDNEGNIWRLDGVAIEGPRLGQRLAPLRAFTAFWFAWPAFYESVDMAS